MGRLPCRISPRDGFSPRGPALSGGSALTEPPLTYFACEPSQWPCGFLVLPQPHFFGAGVWVGAGAACEPSQLP